MCRIRSRMKTSFLRLTALATLLCFVPDTFAAVPAWPAIQGQRQPNVQESAPRPWFDLNRAVGRIEEHPSDGRVPQVILLEDAHGLEEAQKNLEEILVLLKKRMDPSAFLVEGAAGSLDAG